MNIENQNLSLTRKIHDHFSANQFDACLDMAAENVKITAYAFGMVFNGKTEFNEFMQGFKQAFPDMKLEHTNEICEGDRVGLQMTAKGTHTGPLQTPLGIIPPSGKTVELKVAEFFVWNNGLLQSIDNYQDAGTLLRQIGAM